MARSRPTVPTPPELKGDDLQPAGGFVPDVGFPADPEDALDGGADGHTSDGPTVDPEVFALRARVAELEGKLAAVPVAPAPGKYLVTLKDGPTAVVECGSDEHPWDAFKRVTGVIGSIHAPEISRAKPDAIVGLVRPS